MSPRQEITLVGGVAPPLLRYDRQGAPFTHPYATHTPPVRTHTPPVDRLIMLDLTLGKPGSGHCVNCNEE